MTAQISDLFMYQDREYDLAGFSEHTPFSVHPGSSWVEP
jgi:hypothetical protein